MSISRPPSISKAAYWIRNRDSRSVLGVGSKNSNGNARLVGQDRYSNAQSFKDSSQMWRLELVTSSDGACVYIRNMHSNNVLDAEGWGIEGDAQVIIYPKKTPSGNNQYWKLEEVDNDSSQTWCRIVNVCTGKVLEQPADIRQPISSSTWEDRHNQHWSFEPINLPAVYCITHTSTRRCMQYDAQNGATTGRVQSHGSAKTSQLWFLESLSNAHVIRSLADERLVLDLCSHDKVDGTPIIAYPYNGGRNQQWKVAKIDRDDSEDARFWIISVEANNVIQVNEGLQNLQAQKRREDASQSWKFEKYPSILSRKLEDINSQSYFDIKEVIEATDKDMQSPIALRELTSNDDFSQLVVSSSWNDGTQQHRPFTHTVYRIIHCQTGWSLQYDAASGATADIFDSFGSTPSPSELWYLETQENGDACVIRNVEDETKVLDLSGSVTAEDTPVVAYTYHGGLNQQWCITDIDPSDSDNPRVLIVSILAHTVVQVVKGPESGMLRAQTRRDDASQSWRLIQHAGNLTPQVPNRITHHHLSSSDPAETIVQNLITQRHVSQENVSTSISVSRKGDASGAVEVTCKSAGRPESRNMIIRAFGKCFPPGNHASNRSTKNRHLTITLKNTGADYISIKVFDAREKMLMESTIRGGFILELPVKFNLNKPYNFELRCGKESKTFCRRFTKDDVELDVQTIFALS